MSGFLSLLEVAHAQKAAADSCLFILGRIEKIHSTLLGEERVLNIYFPAAYRQDSTQTFPVIYLLDGSADEDFVHIAGILQFMNFPWVNKMPASILVGIANVDRKRDFTFPTQNRNDLRESPSSGHSRAFMDFLEKELEPFVGSHYRVSEKRTIMGESLGGLLATEILLRRPWLFNDYIIVSPSLWWNDGSLLREAGGLMARDHFRGHRVFLSAGSEGSRMAHDMARLEGMLNKFAPGSIRVFSSVFPHETHATVFHLAVYKAFDQMNRKH